MTPALGYSGSAASLLARSIIPWEESVKLRRASPDLPPADKPPAPSRGSQPQKHLKFVVLEDADFVRVITDRAFIRIDVALMLRRQRLEI